MAKRSGDDSGAVADGDLDSFLYAGRNPRGAGALKRSAGVPARESAITKSLLAWLNKQPGCYARKTHGGPYAAGFLDLVGCFKGRFFTIEVKRPGLGIVSALQAAELARWQSAGGMGLIVRSLEELQAFWREWEGTL